MAARPVAAALERILGRSVVVDNRSGAGGMLGEIRGEFPLIAKPHRPGALARKIREVLAGPPPTAFDAVSNLCAHGRERGREAE